MWLPARRISGRATSRRDPAADGPSRPRNHGVFNLIGALVPRPVDFERIPARIRRRGQGATTRNSGAISRRTDAAIRRRRPPQADRNPPVEEPVAIASESRVEARRAALVRFAHTTIASDSGVARSVARNTIDATAAQHSSIIGARRSTRIRFFETGTHTRSRRSSFSPAAKCPVFLPGNGITSSAISLGRGA